MLYLMGLLGVIREGSGYCIEKIKTRHFLKKACLDFFSKNSSDLVAGPFPQWNVISVTIFIVMQFKLCVLWRCTCCMKKSSQFHNCPTSDCRQQAKYSFSSLTETSILNRNQKVRNYLRFNILPMWWLRSESVALHSLFVSFLCSCFLLIFLF